MNNTKLTTDNLYVLCNENQWFTCGTNEQYSKMFDENRNGCTLNELILIIWLCSDSSWTKESIKTTIEKFIKERDEVE